MLKNEAWQSVTGMAQTFVYPIIGRTNIDTSNAFILNSPTAIVIIDPGNLPEQITKISQVVGDVQAEKRRPVIVYLTHCHVDHCFEFLKDPSLLAANVPVYVAIQESGFDAIERQDRGMTCAGQYRTVIPDPNMDIYLLSAEDRRFNTTKKLMLANDLSLEVITNTLVTPGGNTFFAQDIIFNGDRIKAYYTPGHSPDSLSFQVGNILFVGDVMVAAEPFIAGIPGWSKGDLSASVQNLLWLIEDDDIAFVAQGHGEVLASDRAVAILKNMVPRINNIVMRKQFDLSTILASSEYAVDLSQEVTDLVAVMTASMRRVVHYLNILEESGEASRYETAFDSNKLNRLFSAFNEMIDQMHSGKLIEVGLILRSAGLFNKIRKMLKADGLDSVVGEALLSRLERSFGDFITSGSGRAIQQDRTRFEAGELLTQLIGRLKEDIHSDQSILDTLDDEKQFISALIRRIAFKQEFTQVKFMLSDEKDVWIESDRERLEEVIDIIIEMMSHEGSREISFATTENNGVVHITIDGGLIPRCLISDGYQKRMLARRLDWLQGVLSLTSREDSVAVNLAIPRYPKSP